MKKSTSGIDTITDCTYSIIDPETKEVIQEIKKDGFEVKWENGNISYCQNGTTRFIPKDQVIDVVYKQEEEKKPYRYYYQTKIDKIINSFRGGAWGIEDEKDEQEIIEHIISYLPKDLQPSLQNVKPFDLERSIFIARAYKALADNNLIK